MTFRVKTDTDKERSQKRKVGELEWERVPLLHYDPQSQVQKHLLNVSVTTKMLTAASLHVE